MHCRVGFMDYVLRISYCPEKQNRKNKILIYKVVKNTCNLKYYVITYQGICKRMSFYMYKERSYAV